MRNSETKGAFIAAVAVLAALAPFLNKAFHIDDPLFLWMAQQISHHPGDPYGFAVNWYVTAQPMFSTMQNPPLSSYYMALMASFLSWNEPAMHGAFLVPAVAAVLGTFFLARGLCHSPLLAAFLLLFAPVFLVSATGVMCDVWLLALWVWSIDCWLRGVERGSGWFLLLAAILASAAALTKYFGISLVPLLAVYTLVRERKLSAKLLYLFIPIAVIFSYEVITRAKYGQGLFSNAMLYSWKETAQPERHLLQQLLIGFSFTGGCLFSVFFYAPFLKSRKILSIGLALFAVFVLLSYFGFASAVPSTIARIVCATEGALFITVGIGIMALAFAEIIQHKTADSLLLGLWVLGTFFFAAIMNWSITARTFLPMAPAVVILVMRRLQRDAVVAAAVTGGRDSRSLPLRTAAATYWPLLPAALISLLITIGDYRLANTAWHAANTFQQRFRNEPGRVWFEGHWGFQYYMQQWQAKPLDIKQRSLVSGDLLVVPINNTNVHLMPPVPAIDQPEQVSFPQFFVTTISLEIHAGFYSSMWGPLPWVVGSVPPEHYIIFRIK